MQRVTDEQAKNAVEMGRDEVNFMQSMYMVDTLKDYATDLLEARAKLDIAVKALEKISGRGMTGGGIARKALKEIQG